MKTIDLTQGKSATVDDADYEALSKVKWCINGDGYAVRIVRLRANRMEGFRMHRVIMGLAKGDKRQVDHINGDRLDNQRCNLRICTHSENLRNSKTQVNNASGFKGVSRASKSNKWLAHIAVNGNKHRLGSFDTPEEAHEAYKRAALELHGEFANFGA